MKKAVFIVLSNPTDEAQEAEFNQWYDNVHLGDVLQTPGIVRATRYRLTGSRPKDGRGKYLALYEIEAEDPAGIFAVMQETLKRRGEEGSLISHPALAVATFGTYEQIGETRVSPICS